MHSCFASRSGECRLGIPCCIIKKCLDLTQSKSKNVTIVCEASISHSAKGRVGDLGHSWLILLEKAVNVSHLNNHSLQLRVVLNGHLAILPAKAYV